jgi:thiol:disulfide interchange protein
MNHSEPSLLRLQTHTSIFMIRTLCLASALIFATHAGAQFDLAASDPATKASLVSELKTVAPGGKFTVALKLEHPEGWHSYYQNSGGVEQSPAIQWTLPDGFTAGPMQWPTPEVKDGFFGKSFVYQGSPVFLTEITTPATLESGKTITLKADATWQICEDSCLNEKKSFTLTLQSGPEAQADSQATALIQKARSAMPATMPSWKFSASETGDGFLLKVETDAPPTNDPTDFVPDQAFVKSASSGGSIQREGNAWLIQLKRATKDALDNDVPQGKAFSGVLIGADPVRVPETVIVLPTPQPATDAAPPGLLKILGGMLLGGLILNLMPCVFPVIGLKILGFVQQAGSDRKKIAEHGIIFTLGVFASFAVLSGLIFAARSAVGGAQKNWGSQLENPWVVLCVMLLFFVLALNMFGVFEIGASATSVGGSLQSKQGFLGTFFSGVLATVVSTPCSGPFLGVAMGAAISLPAVPFFAAFASMALGLSLPYLILSIFPKLIDSLPRPGPWMESFKQAMSFLLFATAGYLLWVYASQIDLDNLLNPIFGLTCIAVAGWIYGRWNLPHRSKATRGVALVLVLLFAASGVFLAKPPSENAADAKHTATVIDWQPWSLEKQEALLKEGTPVYIDFTAKWCATCQVNKKRAYSEEVIKLMREKGVVALRADKTKSNPAIDEEIRKYGRAAIPVNVLLAPGKPPVILPEFLSPSDVLKPLNGL